MAQRGVETLAAKYRADGLDGHRFGRLRAETRIWSLSPIDTLRCPVRSRREAIGRSADWPEGRPRLWLRLAKRCHVPCRSFTIAHGKSAFDRSGEFHQLERPFDHHLLS